MAFFLRLTLIVPLLLSIGYAHPLEPTNDEALNVRATVGSKSTIVQMFEWTWDSIATECTDFLGPAGYGYVQTSPPQEHITGTEWWTDYQPVSYILTSKRGDRAQFQSMIETCHAAGVLVIADTIFNHMTGNAEGSGVAGSTYTQFVYPGIYEAQDFHYCGLEPGNTIVNYDNEVEVWTCELEGLADLATDTTYVQGRLAEYANDMASLGIDGLRLDAAKNIAPADIEAIVAQFDVSLYLTQEVIWGSGQPVTPELYTGIGQSYLSLSPFRYTTALQSAFLGGGISNLENLSSQGWIDSSDANVFVTNHDTERNGGSLNYESPSNTYTTAMIFSLAYPFGNTVTILSSYEFATTDDGAPNGGTGECSGTGGTDGWICQHRWVAVSGMVGFKNNVGSAALNDWVSPQSEQIAFGRGALGFVAINNADTVWSATFSTSLPAGSYCDVISGTSSSGNCTGTGITVSGGLFTASVPARSAIAIHTGALGTGGSTGPGTGSTGSGSGTVSVTFEETATTTFGENIFISGSIPELGSWDTDDSIALSSADYPVWTLTIDLPANTLFDYKFIRKETDGSIVWESDPNRETTTVTSGSETLTSTWR
ncbi:glycoside hydrolase [Lentinula edodes]|uniref:glycoside hydrolase n=1 Tax=Lentinula edodes TaxID=5353 RepID=UPI001E8DB011|nr:glycoside hydrolase [Lentinula edodes]KAH7872135.1 glycoside hydrolase [Lentinula edodes]